MHSSTIFLSVDGANCPFVDVDNSNWYYEEICIGVKQGYINGYSDGTFRSNEIITREEVASIVKRITNLEENRSLNFADDFEISRNSCGICCKGI